GVLWKKRHQKSENAKFYRILQNVAGGGMVDILKGFTAQLFGKEILGEDQTDGTHCLVILYEVVDQVSTASSRTGGDRAGASSPKGGSASSPRHN
ncbi:unnamed protein product, partial [Amoebophrya sp. A120]